MAFWPTVVQKVDFGGRARLLRRSFCHALFLAAGFSSTQAPYYFDLAHWIRSGSFQVDFSFYLDQLSLVMLLVVTGVGFLIHIYSVGYMWDDDGYYRFMSYLNLFMFFMLTWCWQELSGHVHRLGGRGPRVVPVNRLLVHQRLGGSGRQESIYR